MRPTEEYIQLGLTRTGYISEPSLSEIRAANRLRGQEEKRKKDEEKATREKKRLRKEAHDKENKRREREGHSPETTPELGSKHRQPRSKAPRPAGVDFSESEDFDTEVAGSPLPIQQRAGIETSALTVGEKRPAPVMIEKTPATTADRRSPTPAAGRRSPTPTVGRRSPTPAAGGRSPMPAVGRRVLATAGRGSPMPVTAAGERTPGLRAATPDTAPLAPSKVLKSGASATPCSVAQPPTRGPQALEVTIAKYREVLTRGAQRAQAQADASDACQSSTAVATQSGAEGETGRGSEDRAALPDEGEDTSRGSAEDAAQPRAGGEEAGGDASEHLASQTEGGVPTPEPARAGDEGAAAAAVAQTAPVAVPTEETPAEVTPGAVAPRQHEGPWEVAAAAAAPGTSPVMEMPAEDP
ncbi:nascent polypeptide-associated complex subunit alpha, muscle-specific form-like [Panicum virgatum]|uniref:nascent polypeptide-associated complex subunit alpha, muscle-specific form-like n=1 Tax=Panicum virgatum TaxID=38727 RepID=UPI0019D60DFA|nr:nascent polypeptide-associated complex subunit alpha, muscle-specific form-like [Panicum virgatum]